MGKTEKTYLEEAASARRWARGVRIYGLVMYVIAALFAVLVVLMFVDGFVPQGVVTLVSVLAIGFWGWLARHVQSPGFEEVAEGWEDLESRYGYLYR